MRTVFDKEGLLVLLRDFHNLTGLRAAMFDAWGLETLSYPAELPQFCRLIRATQGGAYGCYLCDQNACRRAQSEKKALIYACHAGLIEVITPILVDGATVGYLLLSHIAQGADEAAEWAVVEERCAQYGVAQEELFKASQDLPRTPYTVLRSAADLLSLAAKAIYQERLARLVPGSPQDMLGRFLNEHLAEKLTSDMICRAMGISRTALYQLAKETYGCGISEHIAHLRIQKAIDLLTQTNLSNGEICRRIGFEDYNYFFRVFRKHTGVTPRAYRRQFLQLPAAEP